MNGTHIRKVVYPWFIRIIALRSRARVHSHTHNPQTKVRESEISG